MDRTTHSDEKFPVDANQAPADESSAYEAPRATSSGHHFSTENADAIEQAAEQAVEGEYETIESLSGEVSFEADPENDFASSHERTQGGLPTSSKHESAPYVRKRRAHKTVAPINDFARDEEDEAAVSHDSEFTLSKAHHGHSSRSWRRSNAEIAQLKKDLHYGQYLQVPKGQRDIFVKKERRMHTGSLIAAVVVLVIIAIVAYFLWTWMSATWGSAVR